MFEDNINNNDLNTPIINKNKYKDNGLLPKIWGPYMWESLHAISFYYPVNPSDEDKDNYKDFFIRLGDLLPCNTCRLSYKTIIEFGTTSLNNNVLKDRESLTKWLYEVHEAVNRRLQVDYGISYEDVVNKYEAYRTSCGHKENQTSPSKGCEALLRNNSFKIANIKSCPIIPMNTAREYINYAKLRGIDENEFYLLNINKDDPKWDSRNKECHNLINKMREEGLASIEDSGPWKDLPTINELQLIMNLSSNLSKDKLLEIIKKLPKNLHSNNKNKKKIYILKK